MINSRGFGSDNHSGVHPEILKSLIAANTGHMPSYGTDPLTRQATLAIQKEFGERAQVFFVFNGTAANVSALRALTKPHQAILCSDISHLNVDECGAPEFLTGCKLLPLPSQNGKIQLEDLKKSLIRRGDQHYSQAKVLSLTQPTELGTVYSLSELKELISWAKEQSLYIHIDGARLANAAYHLKCTFKELTTDLGVDVVSFGGTKNGLMMGEAVIFSNKELTEDFKYIRKQSTQLPSKTRFIAAQFAAYFDNNLWYRIAEHACQTAQYLYEQARDLPSVKIRKSPESNAVFATIPSAWVKPLREKHFFYVWDETTFECRWMTSWDTEKSDIDQFIQSIKELSR